MFEHGSKCVDFLATEGMFQNVERIELIKCYKVMESDHRG